MSEPLKARIVFDQPIAQPPEPILRGAQNFDDRQGENFIPVAAEIEAEEQEGQTEALLSRALKPRRSLWRKIASTRGRDGGAMKFAPVTVVPET